MEKQKNIVCGADIHKKFIMATILSRDGNKIRGRFVMTLDEILLNPASGGASPGSGVATPAL
jgi:hypothetical protein